MKPHHRTFGLDMFLKFAFQWIGYVPNLLLFIYNGNVPKICFSYWMDMFLSLLTHFRLI